MLVEDGQGSYLVKFILKEGVPSTVGIAYAANSNSSSNLEVDLIKSAFSQ